jgi:hypothetical protein
MVSRRRTLKLWLVAWWVACSLGFGFFTALLSDIDSGRAFVVHTVVVGAAWGVPVTLMIMLGFARCDRRARGGRPAAEAALGPRHRQETVMVDVPAAVAFARAVDAVGRIPKASVRRADPASGVIEGRVGMTGSSWGERLTVRVRESGGDRSQVEVVSEPRVALTIFDCGKNRRNVHQFVDALR